MGDAPNDERQLPPPSAPSYAISFRGVEQGRAESFGKLLGSYIREISRFIDLRNLDGVTVAADYPEALATLDRGVEVSQAPTPTSELGIGVAMTLAVKRGEGLKSHIVFKADLILDLEDEGNEFWRDAFHVLAHESAHVEVTAAFAAAFPDVLLEHRLTDLPSAIRWSAANSCWDEYAASRISAPFGADRLANYEETFVAALQETRERVNQHIREYRVHGDHRRILELVGNQYGQLLKFASYLIGHLHGMKLTRETALTASSMLEGSWFEPHFNRLEDALQGLWGRFGTWASLGEFDVLGDIAQDLIAQGGIEIRHMPDGAIFIDVPF